MEARQINIAIYDSLNKKQFQIEIPFSYSECLSISREDFEARMFEQFKKLLKAIVL